MLRHFLAVTILGLFLFGAVGVQSVRAQNPETKTLTATDLDDLPVSTETYMATGHKFEWSFEWDNTYSHLDYACVTPAVVSSDLSVVFCNNNYTTGHKVESGTGNTGYTSDYLRITKIGSPNPILFRNMVFTVKYKTDTPQGPQGP
jgi:hypothetical protein